MKTIFCFLPFSIMLFISCSKQEPISKLDYTYCGKWGSEHHTLEIAQDGSGSYEVSGETIPCRVYFENWNIKFHRVDVEFLPKKKGNFIFHIDMPPSTDSLSGKTQMTLNGEIYFKN